MKTKRVHFTFDERSETSIEQLRQCREFGAIRIWALTNRLRNRLPRSLDPCQWADGLLGRVVQQTVNQEEVWN